MGIIIRLKRWGFTVGCVKIRLNVGQKHSILTLRKNSNKSFEFTHAGRPGTVFCDGISLKCSTALL